MHGSDRRPSSDPTMQRHIAHCDALLVQLSALLSALSDEEYRRDFGSQAGSIGGQVRHVLDHFASLLGGGGVVDYDARERDAQLERCRALTAQRIVELREGLARTTFTRGTLLVRQELGREAEVVEQQGREIQRGELVESARADLGMGAPASRVQGLQRQGLRSSPERELAFVASHCVHHMAMIGLMAKMCGRETPRDFGVASSTLRFRREINTPAARR